MSAAGKLGELNKVSWRRQLDASNQLARRAQSQCGLAIARSGPHMFCKITHLLEADPRAERALIFAKHEQKREHVTEK